VLETRDLTPRVGSEVVTDRDTLLSGEHADELRELLVARGVIVMRDIFFDDDQQKAFTCTLGELRLGSEYERVNGGLLKIVDIAGTRFWHSDLPYDVMPPFASVVTPRVVAPVGGETEIASTYAAFEDLPADEQAYLETLQVRHTMKAAMDKTNPDATLEEIAHWRTYERTNPLVWRHRSGRKSMVLGTAASHIIGMHPYDSRQLLDRLEAHATQPQYVYSHTWRMGDVMVWDNTGVMHRVRAFDLASGRELHRYTIEGVEPLSNDTSEAALTPVS
jgi:alpha-ketoglutarate-dependent taurine dioxygenase